MFDIILEYDKTLASLRSYLDSSEAVEQELFDNIEAEKALVISQYSCDTSSFDPFVSSTPIAGLRNCWSYLICRDKYNISANIFASYQKPQAQIIEESPILFSFCVFINGRTYISQYKATGMIDAQQA